MIKIEFLQIFRVGEDGIYFDDGKIEFSQLENRNGYHGEEILSGGEFVLRFYASEDVKIVFPFYRFGEGESAIKSARAKCGSLALFLAERGVVVKRLN